MCRFAKAAADCREVLSIEYASGGALSAHGSKARACLERCKKHDPQLHSVPIPTRAQSKEASSACESSESASSSQAAPAVHNTLVTRQQQTTSHADSAKTNSSGNANVPPTSNAPNTGDRTEKCEARTAEAREGHHMTSPGETEGRRSSKSNADEGSQNRVQDPARQVTYTHGSIHAQAYKHSCVTLSVL